MARTHNNDFTYERSGNALVEFFFKAGSLFKGREVYYHSETTALELFKTAWATDKLKAMKLLSWLRDCRGGAGNRSGARDIWRWLAENATDWARVNLHLLPELGRWDDLGELVGTPCETEALTFWIEAIRGGNGLAAKWAPRGRTKKLLFNRLCKTAKLTPKAFRKLLVAKTQVVETLMCDKRFHTITYEHVPSVAMARYNQAFARNDEVRFEAWKRKLVNGETTVHADVLFPHDLIRTLSAEIDVQLGYTYLPLVDPTICEFQFSPKECSLVNAQFEALPDYIEKTGMRIMAICDFSYSMSVHVSGSVTAIDVSLALGLYCSDRIGKESPFYRTFIPFSDDSRLVDWRDKSFSIAAQTIPDGYCGTTNISSALYRILDAAKLFKATNDQIPTHLLILSDMQFDEGCSDGLTSVEAAMIDWVQAGYKRPKIIYWNLAGYSGSPATWASKDVALISGFSPSILKAVLGSETLTPLAIVENVIAPYAVVCP